MSDLSPSFEQVVAQLGQRALTTAQHVTLIQEAAEAVRSLFQVQFSSVLSLLPDGGGLFLAGAGWRTGVVGGATVELGAESAGGHVIKTLSPLAIEDLRAQDQFAVSPLQLEHGVVSCLLIPLCGQDRPLGVLGAHGTQPRSFSAQQIARLQIVGHLITYALIAREQDQQQRGQKLLRAEQMMAIGQVAAGVAHELRNPLTSIKGLIQVNARDLKERGLPTDDLAIIEQEVRRMERTLQTFLDFARPPKLNPMRIDLAGVVERVLLLVSGRARKQGVTLEKLLATPPIQVTADSDQLQQLMLNLVLNALDVMPGGGRIEVETRQTADSYAEIYVRDNGPGIAAHILPKIFETFVSNKETGVGLGLPLSRRIAEDHGGTLTAYNLPEAGACFLLRLPSGPHSP